MATMKLSQWSKKSIWTKTRRNTARKGAVEVDTGAIHSPDERIIISIDMMGGDSGLAAVVGGLAKSAQKNQRIGFLLHGDQAKIAPLLSKYKISDICEIQHTDTVISMNEKPSRAVRQGKGTSMWNSVEAVKAGRAKVAVSCGNTGALMAMSMLLLRKVPGVHRPAIAILWPSHNPSGFNIMLDVGADIRAEAQDLVTYAIMGAAYARHGMNLKRPRVGLLNVGTEDHKGREALHDAAERLEAREGEEFQYVGFVEGGDMPSDKVDVIVTDGFTGNVAIKTAEGTASLISGLLREAFKHSIWSRIGALFALTSLKRLAKRIDPRRVNGGVFLGLNGTVIKSHGAADATGVSAAIKLAFQLTDGGFEERLAARVASAALSSNDTVNK